MLQRRRQVWANNLFVWLKETKERWNKLLKKRLETVYVVFYKRWSRLQRKRWSLAKCPREGPTELLWPPEVDKLPSSKLLSRRYSDFLWFVHPVATGVPGANGSHHAAAASTAAVVSLACPLTSDPDPLHPLQLPSSSSPSPSAWSSPASADQPWHTALPGRGGYLKPSQPIRGQAVPLQPHRHRQQIDARRDHANEGGGLFVRKTSRKLLPQTSLWGGGRGGVGWGGSSAISVCV